MSISLSLQRIKQAARWKVCITEHAAKLVNEMQIHVSHQEGDREPPKPAPFSPWSDEGNCVLFLCVAMACNTDKLPEMTFFPLLLPQLQSSTAAFYMFVRISKCVWISSLSPASSLFCWSHKAQITNWPQQHWQTELLNKCSTDQTRQKMLFFLRNLFVKWTLLQNSFCVVVVYQYIYVNNLSSRAECKQVTPIDISCNRLEPPDLYWLKVHSAHHRSITGWFFPIISIWHLGCFDCHWSDALLLKPYCQQQRCFKSWHPFFTLNPHEIFLLLPFYICDTFCPRLQQLVWENVSWQSSG